MLTGCGAEPRKTDAADTAAPSASASESSRLPLSADTLRPTVITDTLPGDSDDPAIWVNETAAGESLVLGTDKGDSTGGVYVFDLAGRIDRTRSVTPLRRMNNVDVEYAHLPPARHASTSPSATGAETGR
ncbi:MAG: phytase [Gemmatimonadaceae bacterium]|nr:phytase [Gemmatimonadaceae bacterium]